MTIIDFENMECNTLTVKQVAEFLGKDPQVIRDQAEREPKYLGFPICKAGHSFTIPRIGFINWYKGMTPMVGYVVAHEYTTGHGMNLNGQAVLY